LTDMRQAWRQAALRAHHAQPPEAPAGQVMAITAW
jgi:hypothetical protein